MGKKQSIDTVTEEAQMLDFNQLFQIYSRTKEIMSKEIKSEENASPNSINKDRLLKKQKSSSLQYTNEKEKFTRMAQQIQTGRRNNHQI